MADIVMACIPMTCMVMASIVMASIAMASIVMACIDMACPDSSVGRFARSPGYDKVAMILVRRLRVRIALIIAAAVYASCRLARALVPGVDVTAKVRTEILVRITKKRVLNFFDLLATPVHDARVLPRPAFLPKAERKPRTGHEGATHAEVL